jgi:AraC-like DNA-binding protein
LADTFPSLTYMELTPMDNLLVGNTGIAAYPAGSTFGPRLLYDFQFLSVIEGKSTAQFDNTRIEALPGTILLGRPGMTDRYDWDRDRRSLVSFLHFSFDYSTPEWPPLKEWPLAHQMNANDILRPLFRYAIGLAPSAIPQRIQLLESTVTLMLHAFLTGQTAVAPEPFGELPEAVEKALGAIRRLLANDPPLPISLDDLARAAHVTPEHLCRLFRRYLDLGPLECAGLARLERAASLLVRSNLPVGQIAEATGFVSPYHFSNKFKKVYGISPRDYRNSMQAGFMIVGNPIIQRLQLHMPAP